MAIVFPASPSVNDTHTVGSITYKWDGDKWIGLGVTPSDKLVEGSNSLEIDANNNLLWSGGNVGILSSTPERKLSITGTDGNFLELKHTTRTGTHYIEHSGVNSETLAFLQNDGSTTNASARIGRGFTAFYRTFDSGVSDSEVLKIDANGQLSIRGTTTAFDGTGVLDALQMYYEIDSGQASIGPYSSGGSTFLSFYTNSGGAAATEKLHISSSGNVSISDGLFTAEKKDATSADTALFRNTTSGGNNRVRINTYANGGGHPYIKFDSGGSNMVVGQRYAGTTNNELVLGTGEDPTGVTGISINGNARFAHTGGHGGAANISDTTYYRINGGASIAQSSSRTFTFTGLTSGWMTIRGGGYSNAGQSQFACAYQLGGYMTATSSYDVVTLQQWTNGATLSISKNASSFQITITNNSATYALAAAFTIESSSYGLAISAT